MPETAPPPLANPVIPATMPGIPHAVSPLERDYAQRSTSGTPQQQGVPPPEYDPTGAAALEAARAQDRGERPAAPAPQRTQQQQPSTSEHDQRDSQQQQDILRPRPSSSPEAKAKRRSDDWNSLKERLAAAEAEVTRYKALQPSTPGTQGDLDIAKLDPAKLSTHPEWAKLKQERDTFYEEVKHTRVEADPEFRAKWDARQNAILGSVKRVAGKAGDEVLEILSDRNPDRRMAALADRIKDFGEGSKHQIIAAAAALSAMEIERDIDIQTRKATWEQTQASRQQQQASAFEQKLGRMNQEFEHVWQEACHPESGVPFLLDDRVKAAVLPDARRIFSGEADARSLARAALNAALLPQVIRTAQAAWQEVERLRAANGAYAQTWPTDEGSPLGNEPGQAPPPVNVHGYDQHFAGGLEAARSRDKGSSGY